MGTGFDNFMATYMQVSTSDIVSSPFRSFSGSTRLRRLQAANVETDVTVNLPSDQSVTKAQATQKLNDLDTTENTALRTSLSQAGADGFNPSITDVADITDGTAVTTVTTIPTVTTTDDDDEGIAGGFIALIVIICVVVVIAIFVAILFFFNKKQKDENNNTNEVRQDSNADNTGEIPPESMDEYGDDVQVRARQFQVNLPQAEDNAGEEPEAIRSGAR